MRHWALKRRCWQQQRRWRFPIDNWQHETFGVRMTRGEYKMVSERNELNSFARPTIHE